MTIGTYDGVHLGHRMVISQVRELAEQRRMPSVLVTFDRHPARVIRPESAPKLLCELPHKLELLEGTGLDFTAVVRFDAERAHEPAEEFVRQSLVRCLGAKIVVVGRDFRFGHARRGDVALLESMGKELGFEVRGLALAEAGGEVVSSTRIRGLIAQGEVSQAGRLLGREHEVRGEVVRGDARGRELGFPTANVALADDLALPCNGIYAGWVGLDGQTFAAAISLGTRPTFGDGSDRRLEAYILDFDDNLYGQELKVRFVQRLRPELRFSDRAALVGQMRSDVAQTRALLGR